MSFLHGFKKNLNRAGQSIRRSGNDRTVDNEFDEEYERFRQLEKKSEKLAKEAKGYLDSLRAMTQAQKRICTILDSFYDESTPMPQSGIEYKKAIERLDEETRTNLDNAYRNTVIEPLARFCSYFPEINEAIKRRQKKLLDYDSAKAKVRRLVDRPSEDPQKLPRAEQEANVARELYENLNTIIVNDLPKVVELRVPYIDPCFEALVKSQLRFSQVSYEQLESLRNYFPPSSTEADQRVDDVLQQMRELTICGNF
ncbi:BAR adaptor protein Hob3 [Mycotypha africana]|uniref:BAR adaptor protein Hob3 n=1 Tax=Mycotypha africana TaxID=64632 RepID=UPI0023016043|nr:BAR adaptor protein Hob3 [Mycotypha africana]KAI8977132.1 BAR adaptor protein Hob3 [Mycotypha africana]